MKAQMNWSGTTLELFAAAERAQRQIPPAFPLEATVAVNPWLGQSRVNRTDASARLARVGGGRLALPRHEIARLIESGDVTAADLAAAAAVNGMEVSKLRQAAKEEPAPVPPLPTVADLAGEHLGTDWAEFVEDRIGHWAAAHFDRGQAFWPTPDQTPWNSWRDYASHDLTPELAGATGFAARVAAAPRDARAAFAEATERLGLTPDMAEVYLHRCLVTLGGWAQYARHIDWIAERDGGKETALFDLLAIRLTWEAALLEIGGARLAEPWEAARLAHATPIAPSEDDLVDAALQDAVDFAAERRLDGQLTGTQDCSASTLPAVQAAFCIDVRSEILRRAIEAADPEIATIGFAGFFGLPLRHKAFGSDVVEARGPILLPPGLATRQAEDDTAERMELRTWRAWGRFKRAAVSAFAFVEAAGPLYLGKLLSASLMRDGASGPDHPVALDLPMDARIAAAGRILRAMSLTEGFARLVLICGHGATVTNAPHASALQCGACGGHAGDVNARMLADLLNDPEVRAGLAGEGIVVPEETRFLAGLHDTVSDTVRLYTGTLPEDHAPDLARLRDALDRAAAIARTERAASLPRGSESTLAARGRDWSELRPEWGLAGCQAFVVAPRHRTAGTALSGKAFLHDYDWQKDGDAAVLELILTAPVVVASWIALQYHGSVTAPETFGAGNKLLHNVVGGIGVVEGNGTMLRTGLPWQSVHDGTSLRHVPGRLIVAVEAPEAMISAVLDRQGEVRALFEKGWLRLIAITPEGRLGRTYQDGAWVDRATECGAKDLLHDCAA